MAVMTEEIAESGGAVSERDDALKQLRQTERQLDDDLATARAERDVLSAAQGKQVTAVAEVQPYLLQVCQALRSRAAELEGQNVGLEAAVAKAAERYEAAQGELAAAREDRKSVV